MDKKEIQEIQVQMNQYIGTKDIRAVPMTAGKYHELRGWEISSDKDPNEEGYLVEYEPDGNPNIEGFAGYISWSPKKPFDRAYKLNNTYQDYLRNEMEELADKIEYIDSCCRTEDRNNLIFQINVIQLHAMKSYYRCLAAKWTQLYGWDSNPARHSSL